MRGIRVVIAFAVVSCEGERHAPAPKVDIPPGPPPVIQPGGYGGPFPGKLVVSRKTTDSDASWDQVELYDNGSVIFSAPHCMWKRGELPPDRVTVLVDALDRAGFFTYGQAATHCPHDVVVSVDASNGDKHNAISFKKCKQPTPSPEAFADAVSAVVGKNPCLEPPPPAPPPSPPREPAPRPVVYKRSGGGFDGSDRGSVFVYADGTVEWSGWPCEQKEKRTTKIAPEKVTALEAAMEKLVEGAPPSPDRRGCSDCVSTFISVGGIFSIDGAAPGYNKVEKLLYSTIGKNPCRASQ